MSLKKICCPKTQFLPLLCLARYSVPENGNFILSWDRFCGFDWLR